MLLLVGAILAAFGTVFLVAAGIVILTLDRELMGDNEAYFPGTFIGAIYLGLAGLSAIGCVFGFLAYARAQDGDWHGAWVFGLVSALVPPLQVVPLLGAIFCLVSPEGEAAKAARPASQPL